MALMLRRFLLAAVALLAAGLAPAQEAPPAPAQETVPAPAAAPATGLDEPITPEAPAPAPVVVPVAVRRADLPAVLDHNGTMDDAVADDQGVRRSVIMGGLDKITARTFKFEAPVGRTVKFRKLMITPRTCHVRPPEETPETSVFMEISEEPADGGENLQRLFSGWMFASSPGLNALEHPVYDVWVIGCHIDDPSNPLAATSGPQIEAEPADKPSIDEDIKDDDAARE